MIFLWIILSLLGLLLIIALSALLMKVVIYVETDDNDLFIRHGYLYKFRVLSDPDEPFLIRGYIFLIPFKIRMDKKS